MQNSQAVTKKIFPKFCSGRAGKVINAGELGTSPPLIGVSRAHSDWARNDERVSKMSPVVSGHGTLEKVSGQSGKSPESLRKVFLDCPGHFGDFPGSRARGPRRHFRDFVGISGPEGPRDRCEGWAGSQFSSLSFVKGCRHFLALSWSLSRDRLQDLCNRKRYCLKKSFCDPVALFCLISGHAVKGATLGKWPSLPTLTSPISGLFS